MFWKFGKKKDNALHTTVAKVIQKFEQMMILDKGDSYAEMVSLEGKVSNTDLVRAPFSSENVVYYVASASVIARKKETFKDNKGFEQKKVINLEKTVYNAFGGDKLYLVDESTPDDVVVEINGGCKIDTEVVVEKEVSSEEFNRYHLDLKFDLDGAEILGYKIKEEVLRNDTFVEVVGEARKSGGKIHICLPQNRKNPFRVSIKR